MLFLGAVSQYQQLFDQDQETSEDDVKEAFQRVYDTYIDEKGILVVNVAYQTSKDITDMLDYVDFRPGSTIFDKATREVISLLCGGLLQRFLKSSEYMEYGASRRERLRTLESLV